MGFTIQLEKPTIKLKLVVGKRLSFFFFLFFFPWESDYKKTLCQAGVPHKKRASNHCCTTAFLIMAKIAFGPVVGPWGHTSGKCYHRSFFLYIQGPIVILPFSSPALLQNTPHTNQPEEHSGQ